MKKKLLCAAGLLALSLGMLTGCGTPSAEDLAKGIYENEIESAVVNITGSVEGSATIEDADAAVTADCDLTVDVQNATSKKMLAAVKGTVSFDVKYDGDKIGQDREIEAYADGKEGKSYYFDEDEEVWYYEDFDASEATDSKKDTEDVVKDFIAKGEVEKKTEDVEGETCYVVTVTPSGEDYVEFMDAASKAADAEDDWDDAKDEIEDELDMSAEELFDLVGGEYKFYISKKNGYLCGVSVDLSGFDAEKFMKETDLADAMDVDIEDVEVKTLKMDITLSDINDTKVEIPDDVSEDAVEAGSYDWEWDDDDVVVDDDDDDDDVDVDDDDDAKDIGVGGAFTISEYFDENTVATMYVPKGYSYDSTWSTDYRVYLNSDEHPYDDISIYYEAEYPYDEYFEDGTVADGYMFEMYEADDFAGHDKVYQIYYGLENDEADYSYMVLLFDKYTDYWDEEAWVSVKIPEAIWSDWTATDVEDFLAELTGNN